MNILQIKGDIVKRVSDLIKVILRKAKTFIGAVIDDNVGIYAAQASFFILISAVPFIMLLISLIKFFVPSHIEQIDMLTAINDFAPQQIINFLTSVVNEVFDQSSTVSVVSVTAVTTLWMSSRGIMALSQGLTGVYKQEKQNYFYARAKSILYTMIFIAALLLTIIVFGFGTKIEEVLKAHFPILGEMARMLLSVRVVLFVIILTLSLALVYKFLSKTSNSFKYQIPGALCSASGWILFSYIYSIYIEHFSRYSYVYGSLTALVFLMLWLYFCMNIFLYGAEINKLYADRFKKKF